MVGSLLGRMRRRSIDHRSGSRHRGRKRRSGLLRHHVPSRPRRASAPGRRPASGGSRTWYPPASSAIWFSAQPSLSKSLRSAASKSRSAKSGVPRPVQAERPPLPSRATTSPCLSAERTGGGFLPRVAEVSSGDRALRVACDHVSCRPGTVQCSPRPDSTGRRTAGWVEPERPRSLRRCRRRQGLPASSAADPF